MRILHCCLCLPGGKHFERLVDVSGTLLLERILASNRVRYLFVAHLPSRFIFSASLFSKFSSPGCERHSEVISSENRSLNHSIDMVSGRESATL